MQIEWQTVVISPYKWSLMIDDDTGKIDFQSAFVCSLQLIDDVFSHFLVLQWYNLIVGAVHKSRRRSCTWKAVWQRWIGRPTVGWRDGLDCCQARNVARPLVIGKPEPETRVWSFPNPKTRVWKRQPGLQTLRVVHHLQVQWCWQVYIKSSLLYHCISVSKLH